MVDPLNPATSHFAQIGLGSDPPILGVIPQTPFWVTRASPRPPPKLLTVGGSSPSFTRQFVETLNNLLPDDWIIFWVEFSKLLSNPFPYCIQQCLPVRKIPIDRSICNISPLVRTYAREILQPSHCRLLFTVGELCRYPVRPES